MQRHTKLNLAAAMLTITLTAPAAAQPDFETILANPLKAAGDLLAEPMSGTMLDAKEPVCDDNGTRVECAILFPPYDMFASFFKASIFYGSARKSVSVTMRLNLVNTSITMMNRRLIHAIGTLGFPNEVINACVDLQKTGPMTELTFDEYGKVYCVLRESNLNGRNIQFSVYP